MTTNRQKIDIIGQGWNFPIRLSMQGGISMASQDEEIRQSIKIILSTSRGERTMRPEFGSLVHEYVFAPNNANTAGLLAYHVEEALARWEPRIELTAVDVEPDPDVPGQMLAYIDYTVKATNDERNLVVPFYIIPTTEE